MSIHANMNLETSERFERQKRTSALLSMTVSLLFITLLALILGLFLLPSFIKENEVIVTYAAKSTDEPTKEIKKITTNVSRTTSQPSSAMSRVIASNAPSPVSIPIPEVTVEVASVDFGTGDDFGDGWSGGGTGSGNGGGSMFGSSSEIMGALKGRLYDLKQDRKGKAITYNSSVENFSEIVLDVEKRDFSERAFKDYFQAPLELSLTNLAIPFTPAELGPEYFGAKDTVKPSGWVAVYQGSIAVQKSGKYRFRAASDDYLVLQVGKKRNLVACWPDLQPSVLEKFDNGSQTGSTKSPIGSAQLHVGKWIDLKAGHPVEITLAIGERPGGLVGFVFEVEKEGETYRTAPDGRKILPLFTTHEFTQEERNEIQARFGSYEFEWDNVPVFGAP